MNKTIYRIYEQIINWHLSHDEQMLFMAGPRQVGKTTISKMTEALTDHFIYLNWDRTAHRQVILQGVDKTAEFAELERVSEQKPIIIFDEIHKYREWKNFLKGFYDTYKGQVHMLVTGSAKLDIYKRGSDSLMGRYFSYHIHPITVAEHLKRPFSDDLYVPQHEISDKDYEDLLNFGGFPEPYIKRDKRFYRRWITTRKERLFQDEIRTLTQIQEIAQIELVSELLKSQICDLINRSDLARKANVAVTTIKRWLTTLEKFYYIFTVTPWTKNVPRSLTKEPKVYLWDWSELTDPGQRSENFIASHLLKAVHYWNDTGLGEFSLHFVRDKEKREVDFLIVKDKKPWILIEVKTSNNNRISEALYRFQEQLKVPHAFQVVIEAPYMNIDCFSYNRPIVVPARTLLSQLV